MGREACGAQPLPPKRGRALTGLVLATSLIATPALARNEANNECRAQLETIRQLDNSVKQWQKQCPGNEKFTYIQINGHPMKVQDPDFNQCKRNISATQMRIEREKGAARVMGCGENIASNR